MTQVIYNGRDNDIRVALREDLSPADLTAVTRVVVEIRYRSGAIATVDSVTAPAGSIIWTVEPGRVDMELGGLSLPLGNGNARIITYDPTNPDGVIWGNFPVSIRV